MRLLRLFSFVVIFFIDVQVKAADLKDCWGKTVPCPIDSREAKRSVEADGLLVILAPHSLIEQRDDSTIQLVSGEFYIETKRTEKFKTPYAKIWCEGECQALIQRQVREFNVKSLQGRWLIQRVGEEQTYALPAGLQMTIGEVAEDGRASMEFPQSLPWIPTIKQWAALYPGGLEKLKPELEKFRKQWKEAVEAASVMQYQSASRTIASYEKSLAEDRARQKAREREDQSLRSLFREKNFVNP